MLESLLQLLGLLDTLFIEKLQLDISSCGLLHNTLHDSTRMLGLQSTEPVRCLLRSICVI